MTRFNSIKRSAYIAAALCSALTLTACSNPIDIVESALSTPTIEEARSAQESATTPQLTG